MPHLPSLFNMLRELIAIPSISSTKPELDQSNPTDYGTRLVDWCETLGFRCQIQPIPRYQLNLILLLS
ncbi:MAG: hypothetical protein R3E08_02495 [Thiotrichaceae bacterium]